MRNPIKEIPKFKVPRHPRTTSHIGIIGLIIQFLKLDAPI